MTAGCAGSKKPSQEAQAIKDPSRGEIIVSNSEIKRVTLEYCLKTLKNNEPEDEARDAVELKEELHKLRMNNKVNDREYQITDVDYFMTLKKFETKRSKVYDFITKAGIRFQLAIFKLCKRLIRKEVFPSRFDYTTLVQLPKKGLAQDLDNKRFIHMKDWLPRRVEALTVGQMKDDIFSAGTKFQIGGCPGKRTVFHLFVVKSNIALKDMQGAGVIMTLLDIIKFF